MVLNCAAAFAAEKKIGNCMPQLWEWGSLIFKTPQLQKAIHIFNGSNFNDLIPSRIICIKAEIKHGTTFCFFHAYLHSISENEIMVLLKIAMHFHVDIYFMKQHFEHYAWEKSSKCSFKEHNIEIWNFI